MQIEQIFITVCVFFIITILSIIFTQIALAKHTQSKLNKSNDADLQTIKIDDSITQTNKCNDGHPQTISDNTNKKDEIEKVEGRLNDIIDARHAKKNNKLN